MLKHFYIIAAMSLLLTSAHAGEFQANATITFRGTSTLHGFEGAVTSAPFSVTFREDSEAGLLWISTTSTINVLDMTTHHKKRDKNMFKMLDAENFSLIKGSLTDAPLPTVGESTAMLHLKIRDIEQEIEVSLSNYQRTGEQIRCRMDFPVSLAAFGLKPPSVMGIIRVGDTVNIECTLQGITK